MLIALSLSLSLSFSLSLARARALSLNTEEMPGSCTACLALLTNEGLLHVLNLGDSGLHLIRNGVSVFQVSVVCPKP